MTDAEKNLDNAKTLKDDLTAQMETLTQKVEAIAVQLEVRDAVEEAMSPTHEERVAEMEEGRKLALAAIKGKGIKPQKGSVRDAVGNVWVKKAGEPQAVKVNEVVEVVKKENDERMEALGKTSDGKPKEAMFLFF